MGLVYKVSDVTGTGDDLKFRVHVNRWPMIPDMTYEELRDAILGNITFDTSGGSAAESEEAHISTPFGDRDCIMYTYDDGDGSKEVYYVGKNNDVLYKEEHLSDDVLFETRTLQKSSLLVESNDTIGLKNAGDIRKGDSASFTTMSMSTLVIEGINLPDGDGAVTYDVRILGEPSDRTLTRDGILEEAGLVLPEYREDGLKRIGMGIVDTSLGKVECDVYAYGDELDIGASFYLSDGALVMNGVGFIGLAAKIYWEHTDLVVAK